jgi:DNA topoisomerase-3
MVTGSAASPRALRDETATGGNKASKLKAIKTALRSAGRVWLATDCDREGQLIGQEILEHCRFHGEVMRVMFTAQDPKTIRDAFATAKPNADYQHLYAAAVARQQSDQIYSLSLTRTATVLLGRGQRAVIGVGRVKTPTLAIVCRRELEICAFRSQTYFEVVAIAPPRAEPSLCARPTRENPPTRGRSVDRGPCRRLHRPALRHGGGEAPSTAAAA